MANKLLITPTYLEQAHGVVYQVIIRLTQIAWRSCRSDERKAQDDFLHKVCLNLLEEERYSLAVDILDYAVTIHNLENDASRRIFIINRANGYSLQGNKQKAAQILSGEDWSASAPKFRMATKIIAGSYSEAAKMLKDMPDDHENGFRKSSYRNEPLFRRIRENPDFIAAFESKFGEPLNNVTLKSATDKAMREVSGEDTANSE